MKDRRMPEQNNHRSWLLVTAWFGTIAFVGLLKRILEHQIPS